MNQKLLFVNIIAVVAAFGISTIVVALDSNNAFAARANCRSKGVVSANVCGLDVGVCANAITSRSQAICTTQQ